MTDISQLSPDDQLRGFSKRPLLPILLLALVIHIVVIAGTSIGYVMELIDPPPAMEEQTVTTVDGDEEGEGDAAATEETDAENGAETTAEAADEGATEPDAPTTQADAMRAEVDALKNDDKVKNKEYVEETFGTTEAPPEDLGASEDLLDFGD